MGRSMLGLPPTPFAPEGLDIVTLNAKDLVRISRYDRGEPYFGHNLANRFDDPSKPPISPFRACYAATSLRAAVAETVLHDEEPVGGRFEIALTEMDSRYVVEFEPSKLKIANLTGVSLKALGGNGALSSMLPYDIPQAWSRAVYDHPDCVDGFQYMSRHVNTDIAAVLFDRAHKKLVAINYTTLFEHPDALVAIKALKINFTSNQ